MLSVPRRLTSLDQNRLDSGNIRRLSITSSEHGYHTMKHPPSLFSASQTDVGSDSASLATTTDLTESVLWDKQRPDSHSAAPYEMSLTRSRLASFTDQYAQPQSTGELELWEFLKEAELEHYFEALVSHLKIRSVEQIKYAEDSDLAEVGFSRPEQRRLHKYFKRACPQTAMGKLYKRLSRSVVGRRSEMTRSMTVSSPKTHTLDTQTNRRCSAIRLNGSSSPSKDKSSYRLIPSNQLDLGPLLGKGRFGQVFRGLWRSELDGDMLVALRVLETRLLAGELSAFFDGLFIQRRLNHENVVRLYGVCVETGSIRIVTEWAPFGSVVDCLRDVRQRSEFPVSVLHQFAVQIVHGMAYISELGLTHGNLAARNILLFNKSIVKISDFTGEFDVFRWGMSDDSPDMLAWHAPEVSHPSQFTTAADVWAYGITLWELFSYGLTPWVKMNGEVIATSEVSGCNRLPQPDACPDAVYNAVMRACWAHEPASRATFRQLSDILPRLVPEPWITTERYSTVENNDLAEVNDGFQSSSNNQLSVSCDELVYVLGKRSSHLWKVISCQTGQIGYLPTSILIPADPEVPSDSADGSKAKSSSVSSLFSKPSRISRREAVPNSLKISRNSGTIARMKTNRGSITADQISSPQNDLRHLGHVGPDGTIVGDLGMLYPVTQDMILKTKESKSEKEPTRRRTSLTLKRSKNANIEISSPQDDFRHLVHVGIDGKIQADLVHAESFNKMTINDPERIHGSETVMQATKSSPSRRRLPIGSAQKLNGEKKSSKSQRNASLLKQPVVENGTVQSSAEYVNDLEFGPVGLDFGTSLLDEVFKCFNMNSDSDNVVENPILQSPPSSSRTSPVGTKLSSNPSSPIFDGYIDPNETNLKTMNTESTIVYNYDDRSSLLKDLPQNAFRGAVTKPDRRFPSSLSLSTVATGGKEKPFVADHTVVKSPTNTRMRRIPFPTLTRRSYSVTRATSSNNITGPGSRRERETEQPLVISNPVFMSKSPTVNSARFSDGRAHSEAPSRSELPQCISRYGNLREAVQPIDDAFVPTESSRFMENGAVHSNHIDSLSTSTTTVFPVHPDTRLNDRTLPNPLITSNRGIRAIRNDFVFRAPTASTTLNRRRFNEPVSSASSDEPKMAINGSRLGGSINRNLQRTNDILTNVKNSNSLLSRLDGLNNAGTQPIDESPSVQRFNGCISAAISTTSSSQTNSVPTYSTLPSYPCKDSQTRDPRSSSSDSVLDDGINSFWGSTFTNAFTNGGTQQDRNRWMRSPSLGTRDVLLAKSPTLVTPRPPLNDHQ